ncbi:MAG: NfeD family protein [Candidatus Helarchaeota archaeon]
MRSSELWKYLILTSICEFFIIILIAAFLIVFYPSLTLYIILGAVGVTVVYLIVKYRIYRPIIEHRPMDPQDEIVGKTGVAVTDLNPRGQVKIRNEVWSAQSASGFIPSGTKIQVIKMEGILLIVKILQSN